MIERPNKSVQATRDGQSSSASRFTLVGPACLSFCVSRRHAMKDTERNEWEQIRARGHGRFIAHHGLLWWGVPFGFVVTFGPVLYDVFTHSALPSVWELVGSFILLTFAFGYGMGETEWRKRERVYHADHG